jgi:hypothetical protein
LWVGISETDAVLLGALGPGFAPFFGVRRIVADCFPIALPLSAASGCNSGANNGLDLMQLFINTFGTRLRRKGDRFRIRKKGDDRASGAEQPAHNNKDCNEKRRKDEGGTSKSLSSTTRIDLWP